VDLTRKIVNCGGGVSTSPPVGDVLFFVSSGLSVKSSVQCTVFESLFPFLFHDKKNVTSLECLQSKEKSKMDFF
jgi:hypothetical protein